MTYAELLARHVPAYLKRIPDPMRQVNVALAASKVDQADNQPSFEAMVVHANPAVRYLGWQGYSEARTLVLGLGRRAETMYRDLM